MNMYKALILLSLALQLIYAKRNFLITVDELNCKYNNTEYVEHFKCNLIQRKNRNYSNVYLRLKKPVADINLHYRVDVYPRSMPNFTFINMPLKGCEFLEAAHKNRYFKVVVRNIQKFINEMPRCPLRANFNYSITDYYLDENDFPPGIPECKYRSSAHFSVDGKEAVSVVSEGSVKYNSPDRTG